MRIPVLFLCLLSLYHTRLQTWNLDCAKAFGIDDHEAAHISNGEPREISHESKSKFLTGRGIEFEPKPFYSYLLTEDSAPTPALQQLLFFFGIPHQSTLEEIVNATQSHWIQTGKERWEFEPIEEDKRMQLLPIFKEIGLCDNVNCSSANYDYALVYGGFYSRVLKRIEQLVREYQRGVRFKRIVLLTGQRFLDPKTTERELPLNTETEMMLFIWEHTLMPETLREIPIQVVDAPRQMRADGSWVRPTTKDTLIEWLKTAPAPGHCLFISGQPLCGYQDSVARTYLPSNFNIETIGIYSDEELAISIYLDNLARWLYQEKIRRATETSGP